MAVKSQFDIVYKIFCGIMGMCVTRSVFTCAPTVCLIVRHNHIRWTGFAIAFIIFSHKRCDHYRYYKIEIFNFDIITRSAGFELMTRVDITDT